MYPQSNPAPTLRPAPAPAPTRKPVPVSWVERHVARSEAAIAFLRAKRFGITRVVTYLTGDPVPTGTFHVSGYDGEFTRAHLIQLAERHGFEHGR